MLHVQATLPENGAQQHRPRILLVDDSESVRTSLSMVLGYNGFAVTEAANVKEALQLIASETFDVLLSDLHMPNAGDGLTVVSAMRHSNPAAVTLIFSGYPGMKEAASAILRQADEVLVKPVPVNQLVETIRARMRQGRVPARATESVASILEQEMQGIIADWFLRVSLEPALGAVNLDAAIRSAHLPALFRELIAHVREPLPLGAGAVSTAARAHGVSRRQQGYTACMLVEESRALQVSIFETLQRNLHRMDFDPLLVGVMTIADELTSQLAQAVASHALDAELGVAC